MIQLVLGKAVLNMPALPMCCTKRWARGGGGGEQTTLLKGFTPGQLGPSQPGLPDPLLEGQDAFVLAWGTWLLQRHCGQQNLAFNQINPHLNLPPRLRKRSASVPHGPALCPLYVCSFGVEIVSFQSLKAKLQC